MSEANCSGHSDGLAWRVAPGPSPWPRPASSLHAQLRLCTHPTLQSAKVHQLGKAHAARGIRLRDDDRDAALPTPRESDREPA